MLLPLQVSAHHEPSTSRFCRQHCAFKHSVRIADFLGTAIHKVSGVEVLTNMTQAVSESISLFAIAQILVMAPWYCVEQQYAYSKALKDPRSAR